MPCSQATGAARRSASPRDSASNSAPELVERARADRYPQFDEQLERALASSSCVVRRWLGVDVGGSRKGFDVALIDHREVLLLRSGLDCDAVIGVVDTARPEVVAIDSPHGATFAEASGPGWHSTENVSITVRTACSPRNAGGHRRLRSYTPSQRLLKRSRTSSGVPARAIVSIISSVTAAIIASPSPRVQAARMASASRSKPATRCVAR